MNVWMRPVHVIFDFLILGKQAPKPGTQNYFHSFKQLVKNTVLPILVIFGIDLKVYASRM